MKTICTTNEHKWHVINKLAVEMGFATETLTTLVIIGRIKLPIICSRCGAIAHKYFMTNTEVLEYACGLPELISYGDNCCQDIKSKIECESKIMEDGVFKCNDPRRALTTVYCDSSHKYPYGCPILIQSACENVK